VLVDDRMAISCRSYAEFNVTKNVSEACCIMVTAGWTFLLQIICSGQCTVTLIYSHKNVWENWI